MWWSHHQGDSPKDCGSFLFTKESKLGLCRAGSLSRTVKPKLKTSAFLVKAQPRVLLPVCRMKSMHEREGCRNSMTAAHQLLLASRFWALASGLWALASGFWGSSSREGNMKILCRGCSLPLLLELLSPHSHEKPPPVSPLLLESLQFLLHYALQSNSLLGQQMPSHILKSMFSKPKTQIFLSQSRSFLEKNITTRGSGFMTIVLNKNFVLFTKFPCSR